MNITVARHVFGSIRGYTTLAKSGDVSPEETAKLEMLSFGQTNESSYLGSLQTNPAYISRPLHSGRWAVTRVFQGKPDDHNRTTLLFISAVITIDDWLYSLKCDVNKLLYYPSLWQWNGEEKLEPIEIAIEDKRETTAPEIRNKVLTLLAAVEKYTRDENTSIVVRTSDFDAKVLRWVNMVLPVASKQTFSCAARSLNDGLPFALISMAREGSFGNSKRKTVNWTPTSTVDNCPYAESLTQFWRPESQPPWHFIDSCKSFLIDLGGEREPERREPLVMRKPLYAEVAKSRIERKTYFSRKLIIILFTCAVVACLATVITIGAMRFKVKKETISLIESNIREAMVFLEQNSLREYFPADKATRERAIEECGPLRYKLEYSLEQTKDPLVKARLKTISSKLDKWLNLAQDANQRYGFLDSLIPQFEVLKRKTKDGVYPDPNTILDVKGLKQSIRNVDEANLVPNYVSEVKENISQIDEWRNTIGSLLNGIEDKVTSLIQSGLLQSQPENYSDEQYEKHDRFKQNLEKLKENETLKNASGSSYEDDKKIATEMIDELDTALAECNSILKKLDGFKEEAKTSFNDANDILNKPNITECTVDAVSNLEKAKSHLDNVDKRWQGMPKLDGLNQKFMNNLKKILKKSEDEIKKMAKVEAPEKPDVHRIKELRKILEKAKLISEKSNVQKIDDQLQQLENLEKKAMDVQASSLNSEEQMRSNGL